MSFKTVDLSSTEERAIADAVRVLNGDLTEFDRERIMLNQEGSVSYRHQLDELMEVDDLLGVFEQDALLGAYVNSADLSCVPVEGGAESGWRPRSRVFGVAASLLVAACAFLFWGGLEEGAEAELSLYMTRVGEQRSVELSDGSRIAMNTGTKILVDLSSNGRRVILERGEAYFDVVSDPTQPFRVEAGDKTITVLGTEFNVDRRGDLLSLAVAEGAVALHGRDEAVGRRPAEFVVDDVPVSVDPAGQYKVSAGMVAQFSAAQTQLQISQPVDIGDYYSWKGGIVNFDGSRLSEVVFELNRYSPKKIVVLDASIMDVPVSASLKVDDIGSALLLMENALPISIQHQFDQIVITSK